MLAHGLLAIGNFKVGQLIQPLLEIPDGQISGKKSCWNRVKGTHALEAGLGGPWQHLLNLKTVRST
jgi:hypothetical protein